MLVNKSIETPTGTVKFEGELEQKELDFVLKIGLNHLLSLGAIPFTTAAKAANIPEESSETTH